MIIRLPGISPRMSNWFVLNSSDQSLNEPITQSFLTDHIVSAVVHYLEFASENIKFEQTIEQNRPIASIDIIYTDRSPIKIQSMYSIRFNTTSDPLTPITFIHHHNFENIIHYHLYKKTEPNHNNTIMNIRMNFQLSLIWETAWMYDLLSYLQKLCPVCLGTNETSDFFSDVGDRIIRYCNTISVTPPYGRFRPVPVEDSTYDVVDSDVPPHPRREMM